MPIQDNQQKQLEQDALAAAREKERAAEAQRAVQSAQSAEVKSDKLLPLLNAARNRYTSSIENLSAKIAKRQEKIAKNEAKIERLTSKADLLSDTNEMLRQLTFGTRLEDAANAIIKKNQRRINQILNVSLPKIERKIARHQARIDTLDKRIASQQRKADQFTALINEALEAKLETNYKRNGTLLKQLHDENVTPEQVQRIGEQLTKSNQVINEVSEKLRELATERNERIFEQLLAKTGYEQVQDSPFARDGLTVLRSPDGKEVAFDGIELATEHLMQAEQEAARAASARVAAMSPQEKKTFMNRADADLLHTPTPSEIAMFDLIAAEERAQAQQMAADLMAEQPDRIFEQLLAKTGYEQVQNNPFAKDGFIVLQSPDGKERAFDGIELATEHLMQAEQEIARAAAARVAAMSSQEKKTFMNHADADLLHTPTPSEIAMFNLIAAEERVQAQQRAVQQTSMIIFSVEQNDEQRFYHANPDVSVLDILNAASQKHPLVSSDALGKRISEAAFAEIEQSAQLSTSVTVDANSKTAVVMEVNGGKGGIAEQDRIEQNVSRRTIDLSHSRAQSAEKINPEYFTTIPKADRQIATMSHDAAQKVMETLKQQGIPFSAVVRNNNLTSITVNKAQHGAVFQNALYTAGQRLPQETAEAQQATQDKIVRASEAARKIEAALNTAGISHRSVQRDQAVIILTNPQDREKVNAIVAKTEQQHRRQFINPEVYAQMPREERFTQRMPEDQAKAVIEQLNAQGVQHSAVLDGDRSAVTVSQKSKGFVLDRQKRAEIVGRAAKAQHQPVKKDAQTKQQDISD